MVVLFSVVIVVQGGEERQELEIKSVTVGMGSWQNDNWNLKSV
jgi:hypothetical protein